MKATIRSFVLLIAGTLWLNCQSRQSTNDTGNTQPANATSADTTCYGYASATDTIRLTLVRSGEAVSGELLYQLAGKDRNTGSITGTIQHDTLLATYNFHSEGVESAREVAFLLRNDTLTEGFGPVAEQNARMVFTDKTKLTFSSKLPLTRQPCAD